MAEIDSSLMRYIPKKHQDKVKSLWRDSDGIWLILKYGWGTDTMGWDCHTIHEDTIPELLKVVRTIIPNRMEQEKLEDE
jgi:hypothetical protein